MKNSFKVEVDQSLDLTNDGIEIINYVDIDEESSSDPAFSSKFSYDDIKVFLLDSFVVINNDTKESRESSILNDNFSIKDKEDADFLLENVRALKDFATKLEQSILNNIE